MKPTDCPFIVRPAQIEDAADINVIRRHEEVLPFLLAMPSESISNNEAFFKEQLTSSFDHIFCAETNVSGHARVIGLAGLHVRRLARQRHSAELGIMIHPDFHRKGVAKKLMATLLDVADNWLMLKRVDLTVNITNHGAIKLYEQFGFVMEGTQKNAVITNGQLTDVYFMARCKI